VVLVVCIAVIFRSPTVTVVTAAQIQSTLDFAVGRIFTTLGFGVTVGLALSRLVLGTIVFTVTAEPICVAAAAIRAGLVRPTRCVFTAEKDVTQRW
jgi:hypothetical protein